jgi:uncharacterized Ntn-hydrolase superfamily protein
VTKIVATFSIVGFDPETDSLAVGSLVPWARAGVGAVATQAMARTYEETSGDLAARLFSTLDAGQTAGGYGGTTTE